MNDLTQLSPDDLFILGNIAGASVAAGQGDNARNIIHCIQQERPRNAGGFIMEAITLQSHQEYERAIAILEYSNAFNMEVNAEEAIVLHTVLLAESGQYDRAYRAATILLSDGRLQTENGKESIQVLYNELKKGYQERATQ